MVAVPSPIRSVWAAAWASATTGSSTARCAGSSSASTGWSTRWNAHSDAYPSSWPAGDPRSVSASPSSRPPAGRTPAGAAHLSRDRLCRRLPQPMKTHLTALATSETGIRGHLLQPLDDLLLREVTFDDLLDHLVRDLVLDGLEEAFRSRLARVDDATGVAPRRGGLRAGGVDPASPCRAMAACLLSSALGRDGADVSVGPEVVPAWKSRHGDAGVGAELAVRSEVGAIGRKPALEQGAYRSSPRWVGRLTYPAATRTWR